jgi:hypothetical protein
MSGKIESWKLLNHDLYIIINQIDNILTSKSTQDPFLLVFSGFVHKASKSLCAINLLYKNNLPEEAQAIVRILFELRITFACFLKLKFDNPEDRYRRVFDSMILEKAKQARASNFGGMSLEEKENILASEKRVSQNYSPEELKKIKQHGFTGINMEERARISGDLDDYNVAYRNFSRNIHSTDYSENLMRHKQFRFSNHDDYIESRDVYSLDLTFTSANEIARNANNFYKLKQDFQLEFILQKKHKLNNNSA